MLVEPNVLERISDGRQLIDKDSANIGIDLSSLTVREHEVLVMLAFGGMTQTEVADWLGLSRGTVATYWARAKTKLRQEIDYTSEDPDD